MENDFDAIAFYNNVSKIYNSDTHPEIDNPDSRYAKGFAALVAERKPNSILEIGCGTGRRLKAIVKYYDTLSESMPKIVGIDPSDKMLSQIGTEIFKNVELRKLSETENIKDNSFDLVYTSGVLCSIQNVDAVNVVKECYRICRCHCLHTDTPKDKPHLNDFDFLSYFKQAGCNILYWSTIFPYPIDGENEHQIMIKKGGNVFFKDEIPLRTKKAKYNESWREIMSRRINKKGVF